MGKIQTIAVIGNGLMGAGISHVFAAAGKDVVMIGRSPERLEAARSAVSRSLQAFVEHGLMDGNGAKAALDRLVTTTDLASAGSAEFVVEAVTEDVPLKQRIFAELDAICPQDCILSSSSGQPASLLAQAMKRRDRIVAAHFWYPAELIPIVEVCPGEDTDPAVTERTMALLREVGKDPVEMLRESPGMIGNRIQFAILREAWSMWAAGIASAEAIDAVVRKTLGRRLGITGPLESAELGGLDTLHAFAESLLPHLDVSPQPASAVTELVRSGARGAANGRGLHDWSAKDATALRRARMDELFRWLQNDREQQD